MRSRSLDSHLPFAESAETEIVESVDGILNLRGEKCPMNFVRTKMKLEEMQAGQNLQVVIDAGEPIQSMPRVIKEEGHKIIKLDRTDKGGFRLLIKKGGGNSDNG